MRFQGLFMAAVFLAASTSLHSEDAVKNYITDLENEDFTKRELASRHLRLMGERVLADLQNAFLKSQSIESQVRIQALMKNIESDVDDSKVKDRRKRAVVEVYPIGDLLRRDDTRSPSLNFGFGGLSISNYNTDPQDPGALITLVKTTIDPRSWEYSEFTINVFRDSLIVCHSPDTQARIAALLQAMRAETQPSIAIKCMQMQTAGPINGVLFTDESLKDLQKSAVKSMTWQLLTRNLRRSVIVDGKQIEYINENRVMSTEGGGVVAGAYPNQSLNGVAIAVLPKLKAERNEITVEFSFNRNDNLEMRDANAVEKFLFGNSQPRTPADKESKDLPAPAKKLDASFTPQLPSADLQMLNTEVNIPQGMWVNAGRIAGKNGSADSYLFLQAEVVPKPPLAR
jgi:hypothetical protein